MFGHHRVSCAFRKLADLSSTRLLEGPVVPLGLRLGEEHHHVVGEDHHHADDEAAELAVARDGQAEREADDREHEAGRRDRELLLDGIDFRVRREPALQLGLSILAQLGDGLLVDAAGELGAPEHVLRVQGHREVLGPGPGLGLPRLSRGVPGAVREDQIDPAVLAAQDQAPAFGEVELRGVRLTWCWPPARPSSRRRCSARRARRAPSPESPRRTPAGGCRSRPSCSSRRR